MKDVIGANEITIGADPEVFVRRGKKYISGHVFKLGDKHSPTKTKYGHIHNDGLALEVNVKPSVSREEFIFNTVAVLGDLRDAITKTDKKSTIVTEPSVLFGKLLNKLPQDISRLGCLPDFNAYSSQRNPTPDSRSPYRTAAGHVHIGWTTGASERSQKHFEQCCQIVKRLDYYLGLPSLVWDHDCERRRLYGKAGSFRPKAYGLEYRVLSNKWVGDQRLMGFVFDRAVAAVKDEFSGKQLNNPEAVSAQKLIDEGVNNWFKSCPELAKELLV